MSASSKSKILVCGDVDGKFDSLFARVRNINKKSGPFELLLCVGNFFGESADSLKPYQDGSLKVPVPTYILGPSCSEHTPLYPDINGCEVCPNVSYLGKRGQLSTSSGLKLAYVSGVETTNESKPEDHVFTRNDVTAVRDICLRGQPNFRGVDILITSTWPKDITNFDKKASNLRPNGSRLISWLAAQIKPRYHICGLEGIFYERPPYINHSAKGDSSEHITRFIGLAKVGNEAKHKWVYAVSVEPVDQMKASDLYQRTTDQTECPYEGNLLQHSLVTPASEKPSQFFFDMNAPAEGGRGRGGGKRGVGMDGEGGGTERKQRPTFDQAQCWFCLASPEVEKHLVVSIGTEVYLALAKGGLVPDHVLILPVGHHQSLSDIPDSVRKEIKQFKSALKKFYREQKKVPVYFERNYKTSHLQLQVVPIRSEDAGELKITFQDSAEEQGIKLEELPVHAKLEQIAPAGTPYFYAELPTGDKLFVRTGKNFPLQFGREVMASKPILDMEDRSDWRDCKISKEEEIELVRQFRTAFQPFDFTL